MRAQDEARVAPGADALVDLLRGGPSLILIDELLQYLISAGGIRVRADDAPRRDPVVPSPAHGGGRERGRRGARVLVAVEQARVPRIHRPASDRRASGRPQGPAPRAGGRQRDPQRHPAPAARRDQPTRARPPPPRTPTAKCSRRCGAPMRRAKRSVGQAEEEGSALRDRIKASYPFHPALIDLMRERWAAIPDFQRTRGALRFLASCLRVRPPRRHVPLSARPRGRSGSRERRAPCLLQGGRPTRGLPGVPGARLRRRQRPRPSYRRPPGSRSDRRSRQAAGHPPRHHDAALLLRRASPGRG